MSKIAFNEARILIDNYKYDAAYKICKQYEQHFACGFLLAGLLVNKLPHKYKNNENLSLDLYIRSFNALEQECQNNDGLAEYIMSQYYKLGLGDVLKDYDEYMLKLIAACNKNNVFALNELANNYFYGSYGNDIDYELAYNTWCKTAKLNNIEAITMKGYCLTYGMGTNQDAKQGVKLLLSASASGNKLACYYMGKLYQEGGLVKQNNKKAFKFMKASADIGYPDAIYEMYNYYNDGVGTSKNIVKAYKYLDTAEAVGCLLAKEEYAIKYFYAKGEQQNFPKAVEYLKIASKGNNTFRAKKLLASCYEKGIYVKKDDKEAYLLYKETADKNEEPECLFKVAKMYNDGVGTVKDSELAFKYFSKAVEKGFADAKYYLSLFYLDGIVVQKDLNKALQLLEEASDSCPKAMMKLAYLLYTGTYKKENVQRAFELLYKAIELGEKEAYYHLGFMYEKGVGIYQSDKDAVEMYAKGASFDNNKCKIELAKCYMLGIGLDVDYDKALSIYSELAVSGDGDAITGLAICYKNGYGTRKDTREAIRLLDEAIELGNGKALYELGVICEEGKGANKNLVKAYSCYAKAAKMGIVEACHKCGVNYFEGRTLQINYDIAIEFFLMAASNHYGPSQFYLGKCYERGLGVESDFEKAVYWYEKAKENGEKRACLNLGIIYFNRKEYEKAISNLNNYEDALCSYYLYQCYKQGHGVEKNEKKAMEYFKKYQKEDKIKMAKTGEKTPIRKAAKK